MTATILMILLLVCPVALLVCALTAPEGYEDEQGFHYGRPE